MAKWGGRHWGAQAQYDQYPQEKGKFRHGREHRDDACAAGSLAARSQGATRAEREARHGLLLAPVEGVRPSSQTSGLQNCGKIDVGCVNHSAPAALF